MIFLIICTVFIGCLVLAIRMVSKSAKGVSILPGSLPLFGHLHLVRVKDLYKTMKFLCTNTKGISVFKFGWKSFYVITNPEEATIVNNRCLDKIFLYEFIKPFFGDVLVASKGAVWKKNRRITDLAFKQHIIDSYLNVFNDQALRLVNTLSKKVDVAYVDVTDEVTRSVFETACLTTMGMRMDGKNFAEDRYVKACHKVFEILTLRLLRPWLILDVLFNRSSLKKEMDESLEIIHETSRRMVQIRKSEHLERLQCKEKFNENEKIKSFLEIIIENTITSEGSVFTDLQLRGLCDNVLLAAFDTIIYELLFTLVCIGSSDDEQDRIYNEILDVLGAEETVTKEHLSRLIYLEAAIKEAIRLYPIAPIVGRDSTTDIQLGNVTIPTGSSILVHLWAINRHKTYWGSDAEEYNPERWLNQATMPGHPNAFTSFSIGRRNCIGKLYAMMYMKTTLAYIVKKYRITSNHEKMEFDYHVMLKVKSGHLMKLELR